MNEPVAENPYASPVAARSLPDAILQREDQGITLEFELNKADVIKLGLGHVKTHPQWRTTYLRGWLRTTAIFALIGIVLWWMSQSPYAGIPGFLMALVFGLGYPFFYRYRIRKSFRHIVNHGRNLGLLGGRRMHFNPRGMYLHNEAGEFFYYWPAIELVVEYLGSIHIYVTSNTAMVVPDRAFDTDAQRVEFLAAIDEMRSGGTAMVVAEKA